MVPWDIGMVEERTLGLKDGVMRPVRCLCDIFEYQDFLRMQCVDGRKCASVVSTSCLTESSPFIPCCFFHIRWRVTFSCMVSATVKRRHRSIGLVDMARPLHSVPMIGLRLATFSCSLALHALLCRGEGQTLDGAVTS